MQVITFCSEHNLMCTGTHLALWDCTRDVGDAILNSGLSDLADLKGPAKTVPQSITSKTNTKRLRYVPHVGRRGLSISGRPVAEKISMQRLT